MKSLEPGPVRDASPDAKSLRMGNDRPLPFDLPSAHEFAEARAAFLDTFLAFWPGPTLATAFDAGTGVGFFAGHLARRHGFRVMASDARVSNVEEARRRHPDLFPGQLRSAIVSLRPGLLCGGFYVRCKKQ